MKKIYKIGIIKNFKNWNKKNFLKNLRKNFLIQKEYLFLQCYRKDKRLSEKIIDRYLIDGFQK